MPIVMVHDSPGATQEQYEEVGARISDGKGLNSLSDWPVDGILSHTAGPTATAGASSTSGSPRRRSSASGR